jgi:hypothetical protein
MTAIRGSFGTTLSLRWARFQSRNCRRSTFDWLQAPTGAELPIHPALQSIKDKQVVMDQPICMFIPHALALREGQVLVAKNSAGVAHNFKWSGDPAVNPGGNVLMPPNTEKPIDDL